VAAEAVVLESGELFKAAYEVLDSVGKESKGRGGSGGPRSRRGALVTRVLVCVDVLPRLRCGR
jgi:hypothetical protein